MTQYLVKRLALAVPTVFGIVSVVFVAMHLAPGDPARMIAGENATPELLHAIREEYGLNDSLLVQFGSYIAHMLQFDLGRSVINGRSVAGELWEHLPPTILLALLSTLVAAVGGIILGVLAARFPRRWPDYGVMGVSMTFVSIPNYVLGILLILLFAVTLGWLPAAASITFAPMDYLLPVLAVGAVGVGIVARMTRASMLEVLGEDYVRTARGKGLPESTVLFRHALRNAMISVITILGVVFGHKIGGLVIIEVIFGINGLGQLLVDSIHARDYPVVQGCILIVAITYVLVNILVDILYVVVDRRIRL